MPSGFKTLGQVARIPSLGVEALKKKVDRLRPSKKSKGKEWGWEWIDDFWFLGSIHWDLCICSDSCVLDSQNHFNESPFSLKLARVGFLSILIQTGFSIITIIVYLPDTNRCTHLFQHYYELNPLFFTENRVCRPQNTVHQHPGQEYPKCDLMFAQLGLTDSWTTPSIYSACARPILPFPWSKTEKYSLR